MTGPTSQTGPEAYSIGFHMFGDPEQSKAGTISVTDESHWALCAAVRGLLNKLSFSLMLLLDSDGGPGARRKSSF